MNMFIPKGTKLVALETARSTENVMEMPGTIYLSAIHWGYLTRELVNSLDEQLLKDLQTGRYLIIYLKRKYWIVLRSEVSLDKF